MGRGLIGNDIRDDAAAGHFRQNIRDVAQEAH